MLRPMRELRFLSLEAWTLATLSRPDGRQREMRDQSIAAAASRDMKGLVSAVR